MSDRTVMPDQLILRRGEADMMGTKLDLIEIRGEDHKIGYYAKLDGNCSIIESVSHYRLDRIKRVDGNCRGAVKRHIKVYRQI